MFIHSDIHISVTTLFLKVAIWIPTLGKSNIEPNLQRF